MILQIIGSGEPSGRGLPLHGGLHGHAAPRLRSLRTDHVVRGKYHDLRYFKYLKYLKYDHAIRGKYQTTSQMRFKTSQPLLNPL